MEIFLQILRYVSGPGLGALIGYLTNWLAVKMLFRPYYPKKIGKFRLPFTPGIISKRKFALAKAVGKAVGEQLFTKDDLGAVVASDKVKQDVAEYAARVWREAGEKTAQEIVNPYISEERRAELKEKAENFISDKIYSAVNKMDIGALVAAEGVKVFNGKKASLGMLAMFLSDELVSSVAQKLSDGVNDYVRTNGRNVIGKAVKTELENALNAPLKKLTESVDESAVKTAAAAVYETAVKKVFEGFAESINVSAVVEEKMNAMDVKELEKLVLFVMKKELNAIVNLGALIGFVLGVIMIFI